MVVDDVLDNFDARTVVLRDHFLEFVDVRPGEVPGLRREKAYRVISPVVVASFLYEIVVVDERMGGKKLDRSNPKAAYVIDNFVVHKTGEGPPIKFRNRGVAHREAAHMGLVEYRSFPWHVRAALISPCEGWIDDPALGHEGRAVPPVEGQITVRRTDGPCTLYP